MRHGCAIGAPWVHDVSQHAFEVRVAHRAKSLSASRLGLWATARAELAAPQHRKGPPQQPRPSDARKSNDQTTCELPENEYLYARIAVPARPTICRAGTFVARAHIFFRAAALEPSRLALGRDRCATQPV